MASKIYNRHNFHRHTFCVFQEKNLQAIEGLKPDYQSPSGSSYYFTSEGVYRLSNHWGRAANCKWRLQSSRNPVSRTRLGFALWSSFYPDNDTEKLYFITLDSNQYVHYQHKDSAEFKPEYQLRTAPETAKIIKEIRNLLTTEAWANYFNQPIEVLRQEIILQLITTNKPLIEIKKSLRNSL